MGKFDWIPFYTELSDRLMTYETDRAGLLRKMEDCFDTLAMKYPFRENGRTLEDIDPFTILGCINRGISDANRHALAAKIAQAFHLKTPLPSGFDGIPVLNNMSAWFFAFAGERKPDDIDHLWQMAKAGIAYADEPTDANRAAFVRWFDVVRAQKKVKWNLTMGLYWMRAETYLSLDERNRSYLTWLGKTYGQQITVPKDMPSGEAYLEFIETCKGYLSDSQGASRTFYALSYDAWLHKDDQTTAQAGEENQRKERSVEGRPIHFWMYTPDNNETLWKECLHEDILCIGFDALGDLAGYDSRKDITERLKTLSDDDVNPTNRSLAAWQFAHEMENGDIVYVKIGLTRLVGRGIVTSDYRFEAERAAYRHVRSVRWTHTGEWSMPVKVARKTLTDFTPYIDDLTKLEAVFTDEEETPVIFKETELEPYTREDFLDEVYLSPASFDMLSELLHYKKNVILQGAPGVGKTFAAKRLAYAIMGVKDPARVAMIQFHQSYGYEDFIVGLRPNDKGGFELSKGPFYTFCNAALNDAENAYFFIIDEINRGNLSKIFGELLMLIENDKRGEKYRLKLLYAGETFYVPENVYIIGMMNTADRSLALMDYALRRRFAFFTMEPAFASDGFCRYIDQKNSPKLRALIEQVQKLNLEIDADESLGKGFEIGHSYFCMKGEAHDGRLRQVVEFELIPLLREYWFDDPARCEKWCEQLRGAIR